jgi:hypothetical protein
MGLPDAMASFTKSCLLNFALELSKSKSSLGSSTVLAGPSRLPPRGAPLPRPPRPRFVPSCTLIWLTFCVMLSTPSLLEFRFASLAMAAATAAVAASVEDFCAGCTGTFDVACASAGAGVVGFCERLAAPGFGNGTATRLFVFAAAGLPVGARVCDAAGGAAATSAVGFESVGGGGGGGRVAEAAGVADISAGFCGGGCGP